MEPLKKIYSSLEGDLREAVFKATSDSAVPIAGELELAEQYKISRKSVRRALKNLEDERLICREPGKGTFILPRAERGSPSSSRSLNVRLVIPWYKPNYVDYDEELIAGVCEYAYQCGHKMTVTSFEDSDPCQLAKDFRRGELDGLIWDRPIPRAYEVIDDFDRQGIPQVTTNVQHKEIHFVGFDAQAELEEPIRFLSSIGHTRIAFLNYTPEYSTPLYQQREDAYFSAMRTLGDNADTYYAKATAEEIGYSLDSLLSIRPGYTAIIVGGHVFHSTFIVWAGRNKIQIPENLSVIFIDDSLLAKTHSTPFSVYTAPRREIGKRCAQIIDGIRRRQITQRAHIRIKGDLIVRGSCAPLSNK